MLLLRISGGKTTKLLILTSKYSTHLLNPMSIPPYQNATGNMNWIRKGNMKNELQRLSMVHFVFSTAEGMNHSLQENSILNCRQVTRTLFYYHFLAVMQTEFFFTCTPLSNHVPTRNQVFSFPLRIPIYTIHLCRGKGPLKVVQVFLCCFICTLYLFFITIVIILI